MPNAATIMIVNGPNLNLLGVRQPDIYGTETLGDIEAACAERSATLGLECDFRQTNHEGEIVSWTHEARSNHDGIIINAGAYSHTSIAILDALRACDLPVVEVHMTNIHSRESFRHHSYISLAATGMICGFGSQGYLLALDAVARLIAEKE
ncbi:type II 3-dehydroquinate dehydratase [Fodinicurvata sp. EGI_FJ10296]|uniref:type II 3-dehydroquinate dehydratase n=1 Tax=Fodinicurvata sp. EGI_FJ10296 TaxID=3231908 RepID=UPI003456249B